MKLSKSILLISVIALLQGISAQNSDVVKLQGYEVGDCYDASNWPVDSGTSTGPLGSQNSTTSS